MLAWEPQLATKLSVQRGKPAGAAGLAESDS